MDGARPSPNIWGSPGIYEIENTAFDREGLVWNALRHIAGDAPWAGADVLDIGCGTGFHLPMFAGRARSVTGVEPHHDLAAIARRRTRRLPSVSVLDGLADALPVADHAVDFAHARWAYFFGPGCEPGLAELDRVMRPGGFAAILDNDPTRSQFGAWFRRGFPSVQADRIDAFWIAQGWNRCPVETAWDFDTRDDLEAVVRIELPAAAADEALATHTGLHVDYAVNVWWRAF